MSRITYEDIIALEHSVVRPPPGTKVSVPVEVWEAMNAIADAVERAGANGTEIEDEFQKSTERKRK